MRRLRQRLVSYFGASRDMAEGSWHVLSLLVALVHQRKRLGHALDAVRGIDSSQLIMREAELAYLRNPKPFTEAESRSDLLRAWTQVLLDATEKVEGDRRDGELYAAAAANRTDEDRAFFEAAAALTSERWKEE